MLEAMKEQIGHSLDLSLHAFHYILKHAKKKKKQRKVAAPGNNISLPLVSPFLKAQQKKKKCKKLYGLLR